MWGGGLANGAGWGVGGGMCVWVGVGGENGGVCHGDTLTCGSVGLPGWAVPPHTHTHTHVRSLSAHSCRVPYPHIYKAHVNVHTAVLVVLPGGPRDLRCSSRLREGCGSETPHMRAWQGHLCRAPKAPSHIMSPRNGCASAGPAPSGSTHGVAQHDGVCVVCVMCVRRAGVRMRVVQIVRGRELKQWSAEGDN